MAMQSFSPIPTTGNWNWGGFQGQPSDNFGQDGASGSGLPYAVPSLPGITPTKTGFGTFGAQAGSLSGDALGAGGASNATGAAGGYGNTGSLPTNLPMASDPYSAAVPAGASYTQQQVTNYLDPNNRQGYGDSQFLNNLGTSFAQSTGRLPSAQDQLYYEQLYQSGADPAEIFKNIGLSDEAKAFGSSGQTNQYQGFIDQQPGLPTAQATPQDASFGFASNPYLRDQTNAITAQQNQLFGDMNNQIRTNSVATGGLGGTREGVAQGVAMGRAATGLDSALAGLYGDAYNSDQNRALSQYGMDQNFYSSQRGQDLQQAGLGASLYNMGTQGQWSPYQNYSGTLSPYTGFGQTTGTSTQGGGAQGWTGGALGTYQLGHAAGWW